MYHEIRADLKARACVIRNAKELTKESQRVGNCLAPEKQMELAALRLDYRYRHVAYSLLRGRTRDQIEKNPRSPLHEPHLQAILKGYQNHVKILKRELQKGLPDPNKLYVIVDDTLPWKYASVQAAHGVAEFLKKNKDTQWSNGTLVVLKAKPHEVEWLIHFGWVPFKEEDLGGQLTAVAQLKSGAPYGQTASIALNFGCGPVAQLVER